MRKNHHSKNVPFKRSRFGIRKTELQGRFLLEMRGLIFIFGLPTISNMEPVMVDVTKITDKIYVGGSLFFDSHYKAAKELGVTHILNAQGEWDDEPNAAKYKMKTCWLPTFDNFSAPDKKDFAEAKAFILDCFEKNGVLLCHCLGGVHRGPMFALFAMGLDGWSIPEAAKLIRDYRSISFFPKVYYEAVINNLATKGMRRV